MTARYAWTSYRTHVGALVWESPLLVADNPALEATASEALYLLSRIAPSDDPLENLQARTERMAFRQILAFISGYTGGAR